MLWSANPRHSACSVIILLLHSWILLWFLLARHCSCHCFNREFHRISDINCGRCIQNPNDLASSHAHDSSMVLIQWSYHRAYNLPPLWSQKKTSRWITTSVREIRPQGQQTLHWVHSLESRSPGSQGSESRFGVDRCRATMNAKKRSLVSIDAGQGFSRGEWDSRGPEHRSNLWFCVVKVQSCDLIQNRFSLFCWCHLCILQCDSVYMLNLNWLSSCQL